MGNLILLIAMVFCLFAAAMSVKPPE